VTKKPGVVQAKTRPSGLVKNEEGDGKKVWVKEVKVKNPGFTLEKEGGKKGKGVDLPGEGGETRGGSV